MAHRIAADVRGGAGAYQANRLATLGKQDGKHSLAVRVPEEHEPFLAHRMPRVVDDLAQRVREDGRCLLERDAVLQKIVRSLLCIPLNGERHSAIQASIKSFNTWLTRLPRAARRT